MSVSIAILPREMIGEIAIQLPVKEFFGLGEVNKIFKSAVAEAISTAAGRQKVKDFIMDKINRTQAQIVSFTDRVVEIMAQIDGPNIFYTTAFVNSTLSEETKSLNEYLSINANVRSLEARLKVLQAQEKKFSN